jgi:hypothetical protein
MRRASQKNLSLDRPDRFKDCQLSLGRQAQTEIVRHPYGHSRARQLPRPEGHIDRGFSTGLGGGFFCGRLQCEKQQYSPMGNERQIAENPVAGHERAVLVD